MTSEKNPESKRYYSIIISGRGGCRKYSKSSKEEYEYWYGGQAQIDLDLHQYTPDQLFTICMSDDSERFVEKIPSSIERGYYWYEHKELADIYGAYLNDAYIEIKELSSNQKDAIVLNSIYGGWLTDFSQEYKASVQKQVIEIKEEFIYVADLYEKCYGNARFFADVLILDEDICCEKFEFFCTSASEFDGDSLFYVTGVSYAGNRLGESECPYDSFHWECPADEYLDIRLKENTDFLNQPKSHHQAQINDGFSYMLGIQSVMVNSIEISDKRNECNSVYPLTGRKLLSFLMSSDLSRDEILQACGYCSVTESGKVRKNIRAFYEALLNVLGISFGRGEIPRGRQVSYRTKVRKDGTILISNYYTKTMGVNAGTEFYIQLYDDKEIQLSCDDKEQDCDCKGVQSFGSEELNYEELDAELIKTDTVYLRLTLFSPSTWLEAQDFSSFEIADLRKVLTLHLISDPNFLQWSDIQEIEILYDGLKHLNSEDCWWVRYLDVDAPRLLDGNLIGYPTLIIKFYLNQEIEFTRGDFARAIGLESCVKVLTRKVAERGDEPFYFESCHEYTHVLSDLEVEKWIDFLVKNNSFCGKRFSGREGSVLPFSDFALEP